MATKRKERASTPSKKSQQKIVLTALELFAEKGYASTSVSAIAKNAKISKGLIYHYFNSKQEILEAIFAHFMEEGAEAFDTKDVDNPKDFVKNMVDYSFKYIINKTKVNRLLIGLTVQPDVTKGLKKQMDQAKEIWMSQLTECFKKLGCENPEAETYLLGAVLDGVGIGYIALGEDYPLQKVKKLIEKKYKL